MVSRTPCNRPVNHGGATRCNARQRDQGSRSTEIMHSHIVPHMTECRDRGKSDTMPSSGGRADGTAVVSLSYPSCAPAHSLHTHTHTRAPQTISFKIPSREIDKTSGKFWTFWNKDTKTFFLQLHFKADRTEANTRPSHGYAPPMNALNPFSNTHQLPPPPMLPPPM